MVSQGSGASSQDEVVTRRWSRGGPLSGSLGLVVVVLLLSLAGWTTYQLFTSPPQADRIEQIDDFVCAKTLAPFKHAVKEGETLPVLSPFSGERTGWPAEKCYWTKEGNAKLTPTYVLLNQYVGKKGPTICPDCGRLVVPHNPLPPAERFEAALKSAGKGVPTTRPST